MRKRSSRKRIRKRRRRFSKKGCATNEEVQGVGGAMGGIALENQHVDIKLGDWIGHTCGNHNFNCRGCRTPRDAGRKPGDWYCACGNWNLNWRGWCNVAKCNKSRAEDEQKP